MKTNRAVVSYMTALGLTAAGAAFACDDHYGTCTIEDWRWENSSIGAIFLDGVATCNEGAITLRLYDGEGGEYLGSTTGYINHHVFEAFVDNAYASNNTLSIKYGIEPW